MSTNCSGERSFSQFAGIKVVKRSTTSQDRLGVLELLYIEKSCYMKLILAQLLMNLLR